MLQSRRTDHQQRPIPLVTERTGQRLQCLADTHLISNHEPAEVLDCHLQGQFLELVEFVVEGVIGGLDTLVDGVVAEELVGAIYAEFLGDGLACAVDEKWDVLELGLGHDAGELGTDCGQAGFWDFPDFVVVAPVAAVLAD